MLAIILAIRLVVVLQWFRCSAAIFFCSQGPSGSLSRRMPLPEIHHRVPRRVLPQRFLLGFGVGAASSPGVLPAARHRHLSNGATQVHTAMIQIILNHTCHNTCHHTCYQTCYRTSMVQMLRNDILLFTGSLSVPELEDAPLPRDSSQGSSKNPSSEVPHRVRSRSRIESRCVAC